MLGYKSTVCYKPLLDGNFDSERGTPDDIGAGVI